MFFTYLNPLQGTKM